MLIIKHLELSRLSDCSGVKKLEDSWGNVWNYKKMIFYLSLVAQEVIEAFWKQISRIQAALEDHKIWNIVMVTERVVCLSIKRLKKVLYLRWSSSFDSHCPL